MERPGVGLSVILMNDCDEVLLGKRKGSHGAGSWSFPGGHFEFGEEFRSCIYRELEEETGLTPKDYILFDSEPSAITNDIFKEENKHYITLFMRAEYGGKSKIKVMEPDKCEEWKWSRWG